MPPRYIRGVERDVPRTGGPSARTTLLWMVLSFVCGFLSYNVVRQFEYLNIWSRADEIAREVAQVSATLTKEASLSAFTHMANDGTLSGIKETSAFEQKPSMTSAASLTQAIEKTQQQQQTQPQIVQKVDPQPQPQQAVQTAKPVETQQQQQQQPVVVTQPAATSTGATVQVPSRVSAEGYPKQIQVLPQGYPISFTNLRPVPMYQHGNVALPATINNADYALTAERVGKYADSQKRILVTWANRHYLDFVLNWAEHVRTAGMTNFIVGAMDDSLLKELVARDIPCFAMSSGLTEQDFGWGTKNFHKMGREKIKLIYMFASLGYTSVISDVDTVWLRNPFPFFDTLPEADILTSSDHLQPTHQRDDQCEDPFRAGHSAYNIGIMYMKPSTVDLAKEWNEMLDKDANIWDQNAFNDLFRRGMNLQGATQNKNLFRGYNGKLLLGVLPVSVFCSGHTYFVSNWAGYYGLQPYVVHATFQYSGTEGKRHRFRERLLWSDPPSYFEGKFLYYEPKISAQELQNAVPKANLLETPGAIPHMKLVHEQMRELRSMYAIAQILQRTLILPPIYCALDRWWAPHDGSIPGSNAKLPFICPADHVIAVELILRERDVNVFGPNIPGIREFSFLKNPRMPAEVLRDRVLVKVCPPDNASCRTEVPPQVMPDTPIVAVESRYDEDGMLKALEPFKDKKLLLLEKPSDLFLFYSNPSKKEMFERRWLDMLQIWCCTRPEKPGRPGHIWYDPFFDVAHKDRHNREWKEIVPETGQYWKPIQGP